MIHRPEPSIAIGARLEREKRPHRTKTLRTIGKARTPRRLRVLSRVEEMLIRVGITAEEVRARLLMDGAIQ